MDLLSFQWSLLAWMLLCAGTGFLLWNRLFRPRLEGRWALLLLLLALAPMLPALRAGMVYGPFDTNVPFLPWADAADAGYEPVSSKVYSHLSAWRRHLARTVRHLARLASLPTWIRPPK